MSKSLQSKTSRMVEAETMNTFRRLPWYKRLRSLRVIQPVRAIEMSDTGIRFQKRKTWEEASWDQLQHPVLRSQSYIQTHRRIGVASDILTFSINGKYQAIDLSPLTPHFEKNEELRHVLLEKLHPSRTQESLPKRLRQLCIMVFMTLLVIVFFLIVTW